MKEPKSYYDLLGVSRTATAQEIRTAYVQLMKRHHPDAAAHGEEISDLAPILNRCYAILRDPAKRAQHDAQFPAPCALQQTPPCLKPAASERAQGKSWQVSLMAGFAAAALAGLIFEIGGGPIFRQIMATTVGQLQPHSPPLEARAELPLPKPGTAKRIANLALTLSAREAEHFSRRCFAAATRQLEAGSADLCVLFDMGFLYWRKTPGSTTTPVYFLDPIVVVRHRAANEFGVGAERRLTELREMALHAMIEEIEAPKDEWAPQIPVESNRF